MISFCRVSHVWNKNSCLFLLAIGLLKIIRFCSLHCTTGIPLTSRETPTSNFYELDWEPGVHSQTSILNRKRLTGVNIYFKMRSKLCWQPLERTFNMRMGVSGSYLVFYFLAPNIDCLNAKMFKADRQSEHSKHPAATRKKRKYLKTGVTRHHHQDTEERSNVKT